MKKKTAETGANVMAFYHGDGFVAAWKQAMQFAGKEGRIATMPEIVAARLESKPGEEPWETYYTTLTAEYYGFSKLGNRILIIAHGIGPMATLEGIQKAYSWQYNDKTRSKDGGRITQQEFLDLEAGKYGDVHVVDFEAYCRRYNYPFLEVLCSSDALSDPVLKARLGMQAEEYILAHANYAREWHRKQAGIDSENRYGFPEDSHKQFLDRRRQQHLKDGAEYSDPYIVKVEGPSNCSYTCKPAGDHRKIEEGYATAHLISTGGLCNLHHEGNESLTNDVGCHGWHDGTRLVGIKSGASIRTGIKTGPDAYKILHENWRKLLKPVFPPDIAPVGFRALVQIGDQWFTQYPKKGECMDTWEPEHVVKTMKEIGEPVLFRTTVGGYHGFFKYGIGEVKALAPMDVNAYSTVGDPQTEWTEGSPTHHTVMVQFYQVEADATKRLMRQEELSRDYERMLKLHEK